MVASSYVFCDASESGFAAVIFSRIIMDDGVCVFLVQARTQLAPMPTTTKPLSIPRLELMGCLIGSRLLASTLKGLRCMVTATYLWWIKRGNDWSVFVRNWVAEIQRLTNLKDWRHVPGSLNPVDLASCGCFPSAYVSQKWWEGPPWLLNETDWPSLNLQSMKSWSKPRYYIEVLKDAKILSHEMW